MGAIRGGGGSQYRPQDIIVLIIKLPRSDLYFKIWCLLMECLESSALQRVLENCIFGVLVFSLVRHPKYRGPLE